MTNSNDKINNNISNNETKVIIQIKRPGEKLEMSTIKEILEGTGIKLDSNYGPYLVNPKEGRIVVRGIADPEAEKKVSKIKGVTIYHDQQLSTDSKIGADGYTEIE